MFHAHLGVALFAAATLSHQGYRVMGFNHEAANAIDECLDEVSGLSLLQTKAELKRSPRVAPLSLELPAVLKVFPANGRTSRTHTSEPLDETFLMETSKVVQRGGGPKRSSQGKETQVTSQPAKASKEFSFASDSAAVENLEGGFSDAMDELIVDTKTASADVKAESIQTLRAKPSEIIHSLRLRTGLKCPMHYPHMHVVNHRVVPPPALEKTVSPSAAAFDQRVSIFTDDRLILTLVSFALMALSSFFNLRRKKDKGLGMPYQLEGANLHEEAPSGELLTVWDGTITTFSSVFGMGFLSLPYAMSQVGWIAAPLILFFTGCANYTAHLLTWVLNEEVQKAADRGCKPIMPGWGFLLGSAYGPRAERFVNIFLVVELWGYVMSGIVATAMNFTQLVDDINVSSAIGLTVLVQFVLTTVPMKTLTRLNVVCNALFVACCFMFIVTGLLLPEKAPPSELKFVKLDGILASCGIIIFSPAAHSLYPAIMQRMEHPEQYPVCLRRAYTFAGVAYVSFAVAGYYLFGDAAQPSAVANIGVDRNLIALPNLGWMNYVAAFCMMMKVSGLQPLILTPLNSTIESMLAGRAPRSVLSTLIPPIVLSVSAVVALHFAHQIASLLNIVGSIFCMSIAFVLPVLCYWKMNQSSVGGLQKVVFTVFIIMGSTFALLGLITALDVV